MLRAFILLLIAFLSGCQSWTTIELSVPDGKEGDVRNRVQEISTTSGLLPCSHWKIRVRNADECYGGQVDGYRVTVVTAPGPKTYVVTLAVVSSGLYDKASFEAFELRYRLALELLFSPQSVKRSKSPILLEIEAE